MVGSTSSGGDAGGIAFIMRPEMYAVNLVSFGGLTREPKHLPLYLLLKDIVTSEVIQADKKRPVHDALLVSEDVTGERWEAICQIIRLKFRRAEFPLYLKTKKGWKII